MEISQSNGRKAKVEEDAAFVSSFFPVYDEKMVARLISSANMFVLSVTCLERKWICFQLDVSMPIQTESSHASSLTNRSLLDF